MTADTMSTDMPAPIRRFIDATNKGAARCVAEGNDVCSTKASFVEHEVVEWRSHP